MCRSLGNIDFQDEISDFVLVVLSYYVKSVELATISYKAIPDNVL